MFSTIGTKQESGFKIGDSPATSLEYNVYLALLKLGLEFTFQYQFFGGRRLRGGMVVDFLVYTTPLPTPIWVHGEYWHMGRQKTIDKLQTALLMHEQEGRVAQPVILWGYQVKTEEDALSAVRKALRL